MICAGCLAPCCRDVLYLTQREFECLRKKKPTLKYVQFGDIFILHPCPFLVDNRCTIYADRPLACVRYPLTVQYRENAVLLVLHFKCPRVPKAASIDMMLAPDDLERMGLFPAEHRQMFVANLILDAEIGRAWKQCTLKDRNKMRIFEAKTKQPNPGSEVILMYLSTGEYAKLVQAMEEILEQNPTSPYPRLAKLVTEILNKTILKDIA